MKRVVFALGVVAIAAAALLPGAMGGSAATPGVTAKIVSIGGTFPFSGPASSYAPIPVGMQAYFSYVNSLRVKGKRGVFGRQILFKAVDDVDHWFARVESPKESYRGLKEQTKRDFNPAALRIRPSSRPSTTSTTGSRGSSRRRRATGG